VAINVPPTQFETKKFEYIAGNLCLDFCNTMGGNREGVPREYFNSYSDFVSWSDQGGLVDRSGADVLLRKSARMPSEAQAVLVRAIALREAKHPQQAVVTFARPYPAWRELFSNILPRNTNCSYLKLLLHRQTVNYLQDNEWTHRRHVVFKATKIDISFRYTLHVKQQRLKQTLK